MSSILEALKKLEAEKNAQLAPIEEPVGGYEDDFMGSSLLRDLGDSPRSRHHRFAPLTFVLAGGLFAVLLVGVSVLVALLLLERGPAVTAVANVESPAAPSELASPPEAAAAETATAAGSASAEDSASAAPATHTDAPEAKPESRPAPKERAPRRNVAPETVAVASEVRYEPYVPEPPKGAKEAPLPGDIRNLPMMTRNERSQYRLEDVSINMLNEANALRPTGNAIINLEKVFIGETLPGSNARLIGVQSHGIAIEIMSTRQRYYIPR